MIEMPEWLPGLVTFKEYHGNWNAYVEAIYSYFREDFVESKPLFRGKLLRLKRHPLSNDKEATFWHMIQEGKCEADRIPVISRCERIRWPKPIIENEEDERIKVWRNERKGERRICLLFECGEEWYLVILADRGSYILPWTAYPVKWEHRRKKLLKEYEVFCRKNPQES